MANLSRKLASSNLSINQVRPELQSPTANQRLRPFPQFTNVALALPSLGVSNYHGLLIRAERRFAQGFNFLGTYTWSKFLNNTNEGGAVLGAEGGPYSDFYNRRADYGPSENDIRHRATVSSVWEIPVGRGRKYLSNSFWGDLAGGWNLGALLTLQSGAPFTVTTQQNTVFSAAGALRADVSRNPNLPASERALDRWFDTAAFSQPALAQFGNQGVNILRADGIQTLDLTVMRVFRLWNEAAKLQVRGEAFNAFNHANFGIPGRVLGAPGFGIVASAGAARTLQVGLRLTY